jgi:sulfatase modifying factor 1
MRSERSEPWRAVGLVLVALVGGAAGAVLALHTGPVQADPKRRTKPAAATHKPSPTRTPAAKIACPPEMARVRSTCIDRYEARLLARDAAGALTPHPAHLRPPEGGGFVAESRAGVKPQAYISRNESAAACEAAGKRLCSVSEWYGACRGQADTLFPYGPKYEAGRCNVNKAHLLSLIFGKDPRGWSYDENFNSPELNQRPGFLAETGSYSGCATPSGVFDLVGNLHEWVSDRVDVTLAKKIPLTDGNRSRLGSNTGKGLFMGGFFSTLNQHGEGCTFATAAHEPAYHDYSTGFRCCTDATD